MLIFDFYSFRFSVRQPFFSCCNCILINITFIFTDYLPSFQPCKWEVNVVYVTGAKLHGECVDKQPQFNLIVGLLMALVSSVVASTITTIFTPVFDILNVRSLEEMEGYGRSKDKKTSKVMPVNEKIPEEKGKFYQLLNHRNVIHTN